MLKELVVSSVIVHEHKNLTLGQMVAFVASVQEFPEFVMHLHKAGQKYKDIIGSSAGAQTGGDKSRKRAKGSGDDAGAAQMEALNIQGAAVKTAKRPRVEKNEPLLEGTDKCRRVDGAQKLHDQSGRRAIRIDKRYKGCSRFQA